MNCFLEGSQA